MEKAKANIFFNARKELSQDAVLATFLTISAENFSVELLKKIIKESTYKCYEYFPNEFKIIDVYLQAQGIDILVEIKSDDKLYAVIIEDKTDTEMHDEQMSKYISKCIDKKCGGEKKYSGVYYIYFKSGILKFWEIDCFEKEKEKIKTDYPDSEVGYFIANYNEYVKYISDEGSNLSSITNYEWISPYSAYLSDLSRQDSTSSWMQYKGKDSSLKDFLSQLSISDDISNKVKVGYASGRGKRNPELWFEGICGEDAERRRKIKQDSSLENTFYFLPIMTMYDEKVEISLNYQIFADPNQSHGYMPKEKIKAKNESLFKEYKAVGETIRKVMKKVEEKSELKKIDNRNSYLKIAKCEVKLNDKGSSCANLIQNHSEIKTAVNQAVNIAKFFKKRFKELKDENVERLANDLVSVLEKGINNEM